ncbi:hypothetical protein [Halobacterium sp. CBA1126]|uniref:hypothetical protein n=1 Tax=Halobacterium sp. CBA1126 TaxID=2668074 RepID=UPI0012F7E3D4|nr:hypothetical protein [Halobacterium sp. CBA1126]MUV59953.1 hypothetical protein [Halobacterium sp. CBA1126]
MSNADAATQHVLEWVRENTEPVADGEQSNHGAVWAGGSNLKGQARKDRIPFDVDELDAALDELQESGDIITWFGLVAPATDEYLDAIIENEVQSDITRNVLIGKCNRLKSGQEVTA